VSYFSAGDCAHVLTDASPSSLVLVPVPATTGSLISICVPTSLLLHCNGDPGLSFQGVPVTVIIRSWSLVAALYPRHHASSNTSTLTLVTARPFAVPLPSPICMTTTPKGQLRLEALHIKLGKCVLRQNRLSGCSSIRIPFQAPTPQFSVQVLMACGHVLTDALAALPVYLAALLWPGRVGTAYEPNSARTRNFVRSARELEGTRRWSQLCSQSKVKAPTPRAEYVDASYKVSRREHLICCQHPY
jgi:hypothetical protein